MSRMFKTAKDKLLTQRKFRDRRWNLAETFFKYFQEKTCQQTKFFGRKDNRARHKWNEQRHITSTSKDYQIPNTKRNTNKNEQSLR